MNIFISGGAGYIGSAAAAALIKTGHSVTVYDSLIKGYKQAVPKAARFVLADLADTDELQSTLKSEKLRCGDALRGIYRSRRKHGRSRTLLPQ